MVMSVTLLDRGGVLGILVMEADLEEMLTITPFPAFFRFSWKCLTVRNGPYNRTVGLDKDVAKT